MQKRWMLFALILSAVFNIAFLGALGYRLYARKHLPPVFRRHDPLRRDLPPPGLERMGLRDDQRKQLKKLWEEMFPRIHEVRGRLNRERDAMVLLLKQDKPDTVQIIQRLIRIGELQFQIEKLLVFQMLKEKEFLDPQQREAYLQMILRRMGDRRPGDRENPRWQQPGLKSMKNDRHTPWHPNRPNSNKERKEQLP
jgi:uncharacterized membrane protein